MATLEGWIFTDDDEDGIYEPYDGEVASNIVDTVMVDGEPRDVSLWGYWYKSGLSYGVHTISAVTPSGYRMTTTSPRDVILDTERSINNNFGYVVDGNVHPHPEKMGVAMSDGMTLDDARILGASWVLYYWPAYDGVADAVNMGLDVVVGIPSCDVAPVRWSQWARISRDFPVTFYFLNEPDLLPDCNAALIPLLYNGFCNITSVYGGQDIYWGNTSTGDVDWMGQFDFPRDHIGTHIYSVSNPDDYGGWRQRLDGVLGFSTGDVIVTEIGSQGATNPIELFNYIADMMDGEDRVTAWMWWNGAGSRLVVDGQLTVLGKAYQERARG